MGSTFFIRFGLALVMGGFLILLPLAPAHAQIGCCLKTNNDTTANPLVTADGNTTEKECKEINWGTGVWYPNHMADGKECKPRVDAPVRPMGEPLIFTPQVSIPGSEYRAGQDVTLREDTGAIADYIIAIMKYSIGAIGLIAAIALMAAGIIWLTAGGNSERVGQAKTMIGSSLVGLFIAFGSFLILSTINRNLVELTVTPVPKIAQLDLDELTRGCCMKKKFVEKDNLTQIITTTETISQNACNNIAETQVDLNNPDAYQSVIFYPGEVAENNECKTTLGCCALSIKLDTGFLAPSGSPQGFLCVNKITVNTCKQFERPTTVWIPTLHWKNAYEAKVIDWKLGISCQDQETMFWCKDKPICEDPLDCKEKLKDFIEN